MQRNLRFGPLEALLLREGWTCQTIKSYGSAVKQLQVRWEKPLPEAKREDLSAHLTYCTKERGYSRSTMKQVVNAIRAYYERVLDFEKDALRLSPHLGNAVYRTYVVSNSCWRCSGRPRT